MTHKLTKSLLSYYSSYMHVQMLYAALFLTTIYNMLTGQSTTIPIFQNPALLECSEENNKLYRHWLFY